MAEAIDAPRIHSLLTGPQLTGCTRWPSNAAQRSLPRLASPPIFWLSKGQSGGVIPRHPAARPEALAEATYLVTPKRVNCWGRFFVARQDFGDAYPPIVSSRVIWATGDLSYATNSSGASRATLNVEGRTHAAEKRATCVHVIFGMTRGDIVEYAIAYALIRARKIAPGLKDGLTEAERYAVADHVVRQLKERGDPWRLDNPWRLDDPWRLDEQAKSGSALGPGQPFNSYRAQNTTSHECSAQARR